MDRGPPDGLGAQGRRTGLGAQGRGPGAQERGPGVQGDRLGGGPSQRGGPWEGSIIINFFVFVDCCSNNLTT